MNVRGLRLVMTSDAVGGVWTYTLDLAAGLVDAGAVVRIAALGPALSGDQRAEAARRGLDVVDCAHPLEWLAADPASVEAAAEALAAAAHAWSADLVHLHAAAFAISDYPCPVVVTHHSCVATWWDAVHATPLPRDLRWRTDLAARGLARADLVVTPTAAYADAVAATYGLTKRPLAIHNGRSPASASGAAAMADEVFTAGRLWDAGKNVAALDRAAASLAWPVRAAGEVAGPDGSRAAFAHLELVGRQTEAEVRARLARRPIYAAPALFEPFGLAVLEAAQAGCALVLNDIATFRELWDGAALFVDAPASGSLAAGLAVLIDDRTRREALGDAARERAGRYTGAAMVERTAAAYAACLRRAALVVA